MVRPIRDVIAGWDAEYDPEEPDALSDPKKTILGDDPKQNLLIG